MAEGPVQNYANHRIFDKALVVIAVFYLAAILLSLTPLLDLGVLYVGAPILIALGASWALFRMRAYATRVQDRIIRLETQLRLQRVLPADLAARVGELQLTHLIGLRFASDAELPELVQKVLADKSMRNDDIKKQVKNWQPDNLRV